MTSDGNQQSARSESDRTAELLDVLGDATAREILRLGKQEIVTVEKLAKQCDVSETTVYRRLRQLHELNLVEKCTQFEAGVFTKGAYRTTMDSITVRATEDGMTTQSGSDDFADAVRTVREVVDFNEVRYDPRHKSVQVDFTLDDDRYKTLLGLSL